MASSFPPPSQPPNELHQDAVLEEKTSKTLDPTNVFVKYLPSAWKDEDLASHFAAFGTILSSKIMVDPTTKTSLGFGFVRFNTSEEALNAIRTMDACKLGTKKLLCKFANSSTTREIVNAAKHQLIKRATDTEVVRQARAADNQAMLMNEASLLPQRARSTPLFGSIHAPIHADSSTSIISPSQPPTSILPQGQHFAAPGFVVVDEDLLKRQLPSSNIYIKGLQSTDDETVLKELFSNFGNIVACKVMVDKVTGQSRQIGFVRFETVDQATRAIKETTGKKHGLSTLSVKYADDERQKEVRKKMRFAGQMTSSSSIANLPLRHLHLSPSAAAPPTTTPSMVSSMHQYGPSMPLQLHTHHPSAATHLSHGSATPQMLSRSYTGTSVNMGAVPASTAPSSASSTMTAVTSSLLSTGIHGHMTVSTSSPSITSHHHPHLAPSTNVSMHRIHSAPNTSISGSSPSSGLTHHPHPVATTNFIGHPVWSYQWNSWVAPCYDATGQVTWVPIMFSGSDNFGNVSDVSPVTISPRGSMMEHNVPHIAYVLPTQMFMAGGYSSYLPASQDQAASPSSNHISTGPQPATYAPAASTIDTATPKENNAATTTTTATFKQTESEAEAPAISPSPSPRHTADSDS